MDVTAITYNLRWFVGISVIRHVINVPIEDMFMLNAIFSVINANWLDLSVQEFEFQQLLYSHCWALEQDPMLLTPSFQKMITISLNCALENVWLAFWLLIQL